MKFLISGTSTMNCFSGALSDPVFLVTASITALAIFTMTWTLRNQTFNGKLFYALTLIGVSWVLLTVGLEAASNDYSCQLQWATAAWLGNALIPVAWCYFVFSYVDNAPWVHKPAARAVMVIVPIAAVAFAATNPWHHLVYAEGTVIPDGGGQINYVHGPGFYLIIAVLYSFVAATLVCLARAFTRAKRDAWLMLTMLTKITITPLVMNAAYVGLGFTIFGLDPTSFMFTLGVLVFSWLLVINKTMDMATVGQSVLFDTMSEPVVLIDRQKNVVLANTAAKSRGLQNDTCPVLKDLRTTIEYFHTSDEATHLRIGQRDYEPRIQKVENPINPSGEGLGWSVTLVDITDRIAINASLQDALQQADEANRAKDEFVSVISHEMRTPLTSLKGGLALALSGHLGELTDHLKSSLEIAHRNGARLSRLIDHILLSQKMDIGALSLEHEPIVLGRLLEESLEENRSFAAERGVQLIQSTIDHSAVVNGDAFAIRQIVDNLMSNAIKFSNDDGVVEGALQITGGKVRLSIKDSGHGIPEGMEDHVFGRFEQVANSGQGSTQGSGLGLHISKQLARQMSGDITYESQVGAGTTFHVEFDLAMQLAEEETRIAG
ncbi:sensor histidine kinase [Roseovarius bejariae]|nr:histidine kinase N-terminal 7TM domain-containing protein [Roseovarius bejariae]